MDGSGMATPDLTVLADPERFAALVADLKADRLPGTPRPPDRVPATSLWIIEDEEHVGFLQVRHTLNDFLLEQGGHIGYSVRPTARRRGHAAAALRDALPIAASLGIQRALVVCDETNTASRATIEGGGGVYEDSRIGKRRYWILTH
jgi:predicted acetyltransferase